MALGRESAHWSVSLWARRAEAVDEAAAILPHCVVSTNLAESLEGCDIAVLCTSPHAIASAGPELKKLLPPTAIITDAGSVKEKIVTALEAELGGRFVGAHPMAGSEQSGIQAAREDLFDGAVCVLTPTASTDPEALEAVRNLWAAAGCVLRELGPAEHDRAIARISHLPHAAAASLVHAAVGANPSFAELGGGGYRDSTRIAGGPESMWAEIFLDNRDELLKGIGDLQTALGTLKLALESGNRNALEAFLSDARRLRSQKPSTE
jgi:prephenate dehydrogenase